ncbi:KRAB [Mytilus edulis]|uniref:KRAB n=1 Tax=Mytilus edulis TaxID=6550 RepID=A0A8S3U2H7_MYTED|nr:KRAB [Mytilus edulis]
MCDVCGNKYTSRIGLSRHLRDHASSRPIECDICHQRFNDNAHFEGHRNSKHLNYKPFKCIVCSKAFAYRQSMARHVKERQGNKSYICIECNAVFNSKRALDQLHSGKHGQKEHTCMCGKSFRWIDKVYFSSDLKDVYVGNNVQGFRKGSTEAIVEIIFKNPNMIEVNVTETPPEEKLSGEKVTTTFIQRLLSGTVEEAKDFQIDTHQVQFTGNFFLQRWQVL